MRLAANALLGLAALSLGGCAAGSKEPPLFEDYRTGFEGLGATVNGLTATPPGVVPTMGRASYSGIIGLRALAFGPDPILGGIEFDVGFGADRISGRADDFRAADDSLLSGSLQIENGILVRELSAVGFSGEIRGTLRGNGAVATIDGDIGGGLRGPDYRYIMGRVDGPALEGSFVAER